MLTNVNNSAHQWGGKNTLIDHLLAQRRGLIISYYKIMGLPPFSQDDASFKNPSEIKNLSDLLIDYISTGHFEIYDALITEYKRNNKSASAVAEIKGLMPKIIETNDPLLSFHDKYTSDSVLFNDLDRDLAMLRKNLESRFKYEDCLISDFVAELKQIA